MQNIAIQVFCADGYPPARLILIRVTVLTAALLLTPVLSGCGSMADMSTIQERELSSGDHVAAREHYTRMVEKLQDTGGLLLATSYRLRAVSSMHLGDYQAALTDCNASLAIDFTINSHSVDYSLRGHVKALLGNQTGAFEDYELSMSPQAVGTFGTGVYNFIGQLHYAVGKSILGDLNGAIELIDKSSSIKIDQPTKLTLHEFKTALMKRSVGDNEGAYSHLRKLEVMSKDTFHKIEGPTFSLVALAFKKQDSQAAAIQRDVLQKARAREQTGDMAGAFKLYVEAHSQAHQLGDPRLQEATFGEIARLYVRLAEKPALSEEGRRHLVEANTHLQARRYREASTSYGSLVRTNPWWPEGFYNRANVLASQGQYDPAIQHMRRYLLLVPGAPNARTAQDKIYEWEAQKSVVKTDGAKSP